MPDVNLKRYLDGIDELQYLEIQNFNNNLIINPNAKVIIIECCSIENFDVANELVNEGVYFDLRTIIGVKTHIIN